MPPAARQAVAAPPSPQYAVVHKSARAKALQAKGQSRTPAETQELIDSLVALLPPGTLT